MPKMNDPTQYPSLMMSGTIEIAAAADEKQSPTFKMLAYTGGAMRLSGWGYPVVVSLAGMTIPSQAMPVRLQHDSDKGVGHTTKVEKTTDTLTAEGKISRDTEFARDVVNSSKNGFPWQVSMGANPNEVVFVAEKQTAKANGKTFSGPFYLVAKSTLGELSFVDIGADTNTSASIAAKNNPLYKEPIMAEQEVKTETTPVVPNVDAKQIVADIRAAAAAEQNRIAGIKAISGITEEISAKAIADGWDATKTELEVLRASRPAAPNVIANSGMTRMDSSVLEAAVLLATGTRVDDVAKKFEGKVVEAAQKQFRSHIGLQQLILEAAWSNGCTARTFRGNEKDVLRAAFSPINAAFSNVSLAGILSNAVNKYLLEGFTATEQAWRAISRIRSVSDFKTITSYRLNGSFLYDEVGADGELKSADLSDESYTNQAKTYGKILGITRQHIVNDDLDAISRVPAQLGRGAGLKLNSVFWTAFMANSSFFTSARGNYLTGATTPLGHDSLTAAVTAFKKVKDAKSVYTGLDPALLLVPVDLEGVARQLYSSSLLMATALGSTSAAAVAPSQNIHTGRYTVVPTRYLTDSALAWYLLASPADAATMEVAFLNGQEQPVVESADADFDTLGIQMRGYHDFGCALAEWQGGLKVKGAS